MIWKDLHQPGFGPDLDHLIPGNLGGLVDQAESKFIVIRILLLEGPDQDHAPLPVRLVHQVPQLPDERNRIAQDLIQGRRIPTLFEPVLLPSTTVFSN